MKSLTRLGLTALATAGLVAGFAGIANASPPSFHPAVGAVFAQTDNVAGNSIAAFQRTASGTLVPEGSYPTGGLGGALQGSVVDHTASESSLAYSDGSLFAVNAGSNSITSFAVVGDHLIRRQVISSGGTFPVSIATHGGLVYVLNARGGGSIQGYLDVGGFLVKVPSWNRALGLNPNATPEFTSTPAQIGFTPDGTKLVVTTKGDSSSIDVFAVNPFALAPTPTVTSIPGAVPFGFTFDRGRHLVITEAGTNAVATYTINPNGKATQIAVSPTGQQATCWIVADGTNLYASNAGSATLSLFSDNGNGALAARGNIPTDAGTVDAAVTPDGAHLYVQTGATGTVDEFAVTQTGSLVKIGSVVVPGGVGGEGIVAL